MHNWPFSSRENEQYTESYPVQLFLNHRGFERASETVWFGNSPSDVPNLALGNSDPTIFSAYTGPDNGLVTGCVADTENGRGGCNSSRKTGFNRESIMALLERDKPPEVAGCRDWSKRCAKAFGASTSLYDQNPLTKRFTGDPIADSFAVVARRNCGLLAIADGVNWGEKSRLAARAALHGAVRHLNRYLALGDALPDTNKALSVLLEAFVAAQANILRIGGGLTTLSVALALPLAGADRSPQFAVTCVSLGDSPVYLWSKTKGLRELTVGSHDLCKARDMRDAGGALGPVHGGKEPELHNLTCALTICDPGDVLLLTSDGVSDNFDPVVQRLAVPWDPAKHCQASENEPQDRPAMRPSERHQYGLKLMERVLLERELELNSVPSAQDVCEALIDSVRATTQARRTLLEDPARRVRDAGRRQSLAEKLMALPGKLDHATVVAYEVGLYQGDEFELYEETAALRSAPRAPVPGGGRGPRASDLDSGCASDPDCCRSSAGPAAANGVRSASNSSDRRCSCSFAPESLSDIEFADTDSDCVME
ncbi:hypothetical protein BOX15_Mlig024927g1 [Macrostomum lignano]|uniref:PPM-type phosphatase domain-containing protein n=1 Tax=Macrostomum lignano TaxID=282301 RepID=A0A267FFF4_9PLAT|nr:hypothetical protein BOX15_Mlig024927g1 [Macrostomum lignano]